MIDLDKLSIIIKYMASQNNHVIAFYNPYQNEFFEWSDVYEYDDSLSLDDFQSNDAWISIIIEPYEDELFTSFIHSLPREMQDHIYYVFSGKGKYKRTIEYFMKLKIYDEFLNFKQNFIKQKAVDWCIIHNISYKKNEF